MALQPAVADAASPAAAYAYYYPRPPWGAPPPPPSLPPCAARYNDPSRHYVSTNAAACPAYSWRCREGWVPFVDECGCGCRYAVGGPRPPVPPPPRPPSPPSVITTCPPGGTGGICTTEYNPTCGCRVTRVRGSRATLDCRTYSNPCQACTATAAGREAHFYFDGMCPEPGPRD